MAVDCVQDYVVADLVHSFELNVVTCCGLHYNLQHMDSKKIHMTWHKLCCRDQMATSSTVDRSSCPSAVR